MSLTLAVAAALARQCAPQVAVPTMLALVSNESGFDAYAIGDNSTGRSYHMGSARAAATQASALVAAGHSVDMGLGQINSRTARTLGLSIGEAFDPCSNLAAAARLMVASYRQLAPVSPTAQHAIAGMLSTYNTGNRARGIRNGYVAKVYAAAARVRPVLAYDEAVAAALPIAAAAQGRRAKLPASDARPASVMLPSPAWEVFGGPAASTAVFEVTSPKGRNL